ncbi:DUF6457 domain-containing protein [Arthrobacter sp. H14]|uniref:DUF6457 domain-containing protein n=1 Tax=Arthrobacter sp. H14 TaxID=1312959 RepID=UPI0004B771F6|nr:DUF6457 domain-containing protein [Arthrobacter sp. H14]
MTDQKQILEPWCRQLIEALELQGLEVDIDEVLALAGEAAHAVVRPAAPLTTFIVGYAAGCASATGQASDDVAIRSASEVARRLVREAKQDDDGGSGPGAGGRSPKAGHGSGTDAGRGEGAGDGSGLDTAGEDASAAQAQEAVQATFGSGTPEGRKP